MDTTLTNLISQYQKVRQLLVQNSCTHQDFILPSKLSPRERQIWQAIQQDIGGLQGWLEDFETLLLQNRTSQNTALPEVEERIRNFQVRQTVTSALSPLLLAGLLGADASSGNTDNDPFSYLDCDWCGKRFAGKRFLHRYHQHCRDRHWKL